MDERHRAGSVDDSNPVADSLQQCMDERHRAGCVDESNPVADSLQGSTAVYGLEAPGRQCR